MTAAAREERRGDALEQAPAGQRNRAAEIAPERQAHADARQRVQDRGRRRDLEPRLSRRPEQAEDLRGAARESDARCDLDHPMPLLPVGPHPLGDGERGVAEEVNRILGSELESLEAGNPAEAAAILFARHFAEDPGRVDPDSIENLRRKRSTTGRLAKILAYVRVITFGNLLGNTVDALLGRIRRRRP